MSRDKMVIMEVDADIIMTALQTLCDMMVTTKHNPGLLSMIPDDPARLMVTILEMTIKMRNRPDAPSDEEIKNSRKKMEEILAKVAKS